MRSAAGSAWTRWSSQRNAFVTGSLMLIGTPFPWYRPLGHRLDRVGAHPLDRSARAGALPARPRPRARLLARHVDDLGPPHHHRRRWTPDGHDEYIVDISGVRTLWRRWWRRVRPAHGRRARPVRRLQSRSAHRCHRGSRVARTSTGRARRGQPRCARPAAHPRRREIADARPDQLDYTRGCFSACSTHRRQPSATPSSCRPRSPTAPMVGRGISTNLPLGVEIGAHVCERRGRHRHRLVTVLATRPLQDVGLALNPTTVEGRIAGSVVQGIGWALIEGFDYDADGHLRNAACSTIGMPTRARCAADRVRRVERPSRPPYGVRGVGEVRSFHRGGHSQRHRRAIGVRSATCR